MYVASLLRLLTYLLAFNSFQLAFILYIATNPPSVNTSLIMLLSLLKSFSNSPLSIRCASLVAQSLLLLQCKRLPEMQETQIQSLGQEDPLEEEMTTYSSILAWEIPRTEEPGGLQSTGSQKSQT